MPCAPGFYGLPEVVLEALAAERDIDVFRSRPGGNFCDDRSSLSVRPPSDPRETIPADAATVSCTPINDHSVSRANTC
jgi:hypothetical protein